MNKEKIIASCAILGISTQADLPTIKKAYWQKVKVVHPDINNAETAHNDFIKLTAAYNFLINLLVPGQTVYELLDIYTSKTILEQPTYTNTYNENEFKKEALKQASMRYNTFINSNEYKLEVATDVFLSHIKFGLLILFFMILGFFIYKSISNGINGGAILIALIFSPFLYFLFTLKKLLNVKAFKSAFKVLIADKVSGTLLYLVLCFLIFIFGLVFLATETMIPFVDMLLFFVAATITLMLVFMLINKILKTKNNHLFIFRKSVLASVIIGNLLLALNFFVSKNTNIYVEDYVFKADHPIWQQPNYLPIAYGKYDDLEGVHSLRKEYEEDTKMDFISFKYAEGLLGYMVIKGFVTKK